MIYEKLDNLVHISKGKKYSEINYLPNSNRYINIEDLHGGNETRYTLDDGVTVDPTDVLIAWDGANAGKVGVGFTGVIGSTLARLSLKDDRINSKFLYWFLFSCSDKIKSQRTGATIPHVNGTALRNMQIPLPPLETQKRIAAILDKADALRQNDQELLKKYDDLAQAIFIDMFGDPVKNEKGWEMKTIEQIVAKIPNAIKRGPFGGTLKKEIFVPAGFLIYEQYHALNNDFTFGRYYIDPAKYKELQGFKVQPGDIIISCSGVYLGKLAIVPQGAEDGIINQALLKLTLDQNIYNNDFFVKVFTQKSFKEKYFASERGAAIPNFPPMSSFKSFKFICPPIELQNKYHLIITNIKQQLSLLGTENIKVNELFDQLTNKCFQNKILKEEVFSE